MRLLHFVHLIVVGIAPLTQLCCASFEPVEPAIESNFVGPFELRDGQVPEQIGPPNETIKEQKPAPPDIEGTYHAIGENADKTSYTIVVTIKKRLDGYTVTWHQDWVLPQRGFGFLRGNDLIVGYTPYGSNAAGVAVFTMDDKRNFNGKWMLPNTSWVNERLVKLREQ